MCRDEVLGAMVSVLIILFIKSGSISKPLHNTVCLEWRYFKTPPSYCLFRVGYWQWSNLPIMFNIVSSWVTGSSLASPLCCLLKVVVLALVAPPHHNNYVFRGEVLADLPIFLLFRVEVLGAVGSVLIILLIWRGKTCRPPNISFV